PTLFKDVCGSYVGELLTPEQLDQVVDDAFRTALATSSPTCIIVPHDVQQAEAPELEHAHGIVPSAPVIATPRVLPADADLDRAAGLLIAGQRVALLVGQGSRHATAEVHEIAELLGA